MCLTIKLFYLKYETVIKANPVLSRLFDEFFLHCEAMNEAVQIQMGHTSEATKLKQKEEQEMVAAVCQLASKAYVYAVEKKLPGLIEKFDVSEWELKRLGDVALHAECLSIYQTLAAIDPVAIAEYGVTTTDVTSTKKEIDDFYVMISVPRSKIITRSQATAKIEEEMVLLQDLLSKRLDKMVYALPETNAVMKNEYKAARIMVDRSSNKPGNNDDTPTA
jgi:hypothetical protein